MSDTLTTEAPTGSVLPRSPASFDELGLPLSVLTDLVLRRTLLDGKTSTMSLSRKLAISVPLVEALARDLRDKKMLEMLGMEGRDSVLTLTDLGRQTANQRYQQSQYADAAPVTLADYTRVTGDQRSRIHITRSGMKHAFGDLVVAQELLDQLGPAMISPGAVFLYGPPGTGKTSLAERMIRVHNDHVLVPRAVEVDSQIVSVFDPVVHRPAAVQPPEMDPRYVLCHRPCVVAGGELTAGLLELTFDASTGVYLAPLQMKANNGIFVIDDFGRQRMTPDELLNRWIVPLDRQIDFLSLTYGVKFTVPFDVKVVFSTNLEPRSLGDEAFFRRIHNKIYVGAVSDDEFDWILARVVRARGIECTNEAAAYLRQACRENGHGELRPYLPADVCEILQAVCLYDETPVIMTPENIDKVAAIYFARDFDDPMPPVVPAAIPHADD